VICDRITATGTGQRLLAGVAGMIAAVALVTVLVVSGIQLTVSVLVLLLPALLIIGFLLLIIRVLLFGLRRRHRARRGGSGHLATGAAKGLARIVTASIRAGSIDENASEQRLVQSLAAHIDAQTNRQVAAVRFTDRPLAAAIGAGIAVVLALLSLPSGSGFAFFMLLVALCAGGWAGYQCFQLQPQRDHLRKIGEQRKTTACAQVRGAIAEMIDWRTSGEREIGKATGFRDYMNALTRDSFVAAAPDRAREVLA
jgi:hypothetical protein